MNRRGFLGILGAAIAGAAYDPERALWVPGKLISIPKPRVFGFIPYPPPYVTIVEEITFAEFCRRYPPRSESDARFMDEWPISKNVPIRAALSRYDGSIVSIFEQASSTFPVPR